MILTALPKSTSAPGSASGPLPHDAPGGGTTNRSGPPAFPASLSARQARDSGLLTSGTCGPPGTGLSTSAALTSSLASRLRAETATLGSTLYNLTWKDRAMPSGRSKPSLVGSARRTSAPEITGVPWPTPSAMDSSNTGSAWEERRDRVKVHLGNGNGFGMILPMASQLTAWPTTTRDWKDGGNPDVNVSLNALLGRVVWLAGWPTSRGADGEKNVRTLEGAQGRPSGSVDGNGTGGMADPDGGVGQYRDVQSGGQHGQQPQDGRAGRRDDSGPRSDVTSGLVRPGPTNGLWADPDWLYCRDEKWRPVESSTFPLADAGAFRNRVGLLRGAGNAVTLGQAEAWLRALRGTLK